jgi:hypothetical protein
MNTVGPAISLRTSCCDFPQKLQYRVLLLSEPLNLVIPVSSNPQSQVCSRRAEIRQVYLARRTNQPRARFFLLKEPQVNGEDR